MNILFVYAFSPIFTYIARGLKEHHCVFATFRQEYAHEPVNPMYRFSRRLNIVKSFDPILQDQEIQDAFAYSLSLNVVHVKRKDVVELGRKYEQFYLWIFKEEEIEALVNYNTAYAFQKIGHLLAKRVGLKTAILETGYYRPFTLTCEINGLNAQSSIKDWIPQNKHSTGSNNFRDFIDQYVWQRLKLSTGNQTRIPDYRPSTVHRFLREIRQRIWYNRFDPEGYEHQWVLRILKVLMNGIHRILSDQRLLQEYIVFFLSSHHDPQIPLPAKESINSILAKLLDAYNIFRKFNPNIILIIKEHPHDYSRVIHRSVIRSYFRKGVMVSHLSAPTLLDNARGVITISSGVGIDALMRGKPLLCLDESIYCRQGISLSVPKPISIERITEGLEQLLEYHPDGSEILSYLHAIYERIQLSCWCEKDWKKAIGNQLVEKLQEKS